MPTCDVLRCQNAMTGVFATGDGSRRIEYRVCAEHQQYLRDGGDWRLDPGSGGGRETLLVHPDDLAGDGTLLVERGLGMKASIATSLSSRNRDGADSPAVLTFEVKRWGSPDTDVLALQFTRQQLLDLRDTLNSAYGSAE